jgi:hypothetical protein
MAESGQRWQVLRLWRVRSPWRLAVLAAVPAGVMWWRWGLAGLAGASGIALVGGLIVWAVVMPGRAAPPVPTETLDKSATLKPGWR